MIKKLGIVTALSTAVLFGGAFSNTVDASTNIDSQKQNQQTFKVYYSINGQSFSNADLSNLDGNLNETVQKILANYQVNWNNQSAPEKPAAPAVEKPEPKKEAPKQEAPKQEAPKQEAPEKAEAPEPAPAPAPAPQEPAQEKQTQAQSDQLNAYEQQVVELTNNERVERGLAPLAVDDELSVVAREKSRDMSANNYFSHTSPTYGSPFDMMKSYGIDYRSAGENIARGQRTPEEVVNGWMNSSGHRANILSSKFTHIGVGYIADGNYWTQQFIGK
ncbi:CAP domain-containing protein [Virgibacillus flavescens]|uniref:CAP domain-containing protein n=1 Tax=Virgibacillus flavescens TaxID=1611422 RepID=UPI003D353B47